LQYIVTDGSTFASTETANTTHTISLADPTSLVWQQVNTATNGDFKITKTYIADPSRSVILIQATFDNLSSSPLQLYADYLPQLNNDGMGNTGGTDSTSGDLVASNYGLTSTYSSAATAGHIVQVAQIPVAASGSTTFTLALAFDSSQ
jgi:Glucodextranase, domain N